MRVLRLINSDLEDAWIMETSLGPDWSDQTSVILQLARPHLDAVEVKELYRDDLNTIDEFATFDQLWEDRVVPDQFNEAFDACFAFANWMK